MEFFTCPCPETGDVMLDDKNLGPNRDAGGKLLTKQCNPGLHTVVLRFSDGRCCDPSSVKVRIRETDPILPMEVPFKCV
ncbi:MAG TPA: hypothetical protein DCZ75_04465 [Geobacter sp.]|nr:hypothetical protein [Geobacter sp.]